MSATLMEKPRDDEKARGTEASGEQVFVTLVLADQLCGIPVLMVRDVLAAQNITRIPLAPAEIAGSLNLRGRIVTAIDLRRRLGLAEARAEATRMAVVTEQSGELYAFLVDQVSEVLSLSGRDFERNPATLPAVWASHSRGIYRLSGRLMVVLDVARILALAPVQ